MVRHRRCYVESGGYTSSSSCAPQACVMCGRPVFTGQASTNWPAPNDPDANQYGRLVRHPQATTDGPLLYRFDRKWGRSRTAREENPDGAR